MCLDSIGKVYPTKFTDGLGMGEGWERKDDSKDVDLSQRSMVVLSSSVGKIVKKSAVLDLFTGRPVRYPRGGTTGQPFPLLLSLLSLDEGRCLASGSSSPWGFFPPSSPQFFGTYLLARL